MVSGAVKTTETLLGVWPIGCWRVPCSWRRAKEQLLPSAQLQVPSSSLLRLFASLNTAERPTRIADKESYLRRQRRSATDTADSGRTANSAVRRSIRHVAPMSGVRGRCASLCAPRGDPGVPTPRERRLVKRRRPPRRPIRAELLAGSGGVDADQVSANRFGVILR
jgi:hypothetical protein